MCVRVFCRNLAFIVMVCVFRSGSCSRTVRAVFRVGVEFSAFDVFSEVLTIPKDYRLADQHHRERLRYQ